MKQFHKHVLIGLIVTHLVACGKKEEDEKTEEDAATSDSTHVEDVAGIYTAVNAQLGSLHITDYGAGLALAEETWTSDDWGTTTRFNCFGECSGSVPAKTFVDDALNADKSGPVGQIHKKLDVFCYIGAFFASSDMDDGGLPKVVTDHTLTIDSSAADRLKNGCGMSDAQVAEFQEGQANGATIAVTVTEVTGDVFDRYLVLKMGSGDEIEQYPFYIKNSEGIVSVAMSESYTHNGSPAFSRSLFKFDLDSKEFRFEAVGRTEATGTNVENGGSFSFDRGYYNGTTKEVAFLSVMGSDYYQANATFLALSGNEGETETGAYLARTAQDETALAGAFVCFNKATGAFVNSTGCTENADENRKHVWNSESALFTSIRSKTSADWALDGTTEVPSFTASTVFSELPNYKQ